MFKPTDDGTSRHLIAFVPVYGRPEDGSLFYLFFILFYLQRELKDIKKTKLSAISLLPSDLSVKF